MPVLNSSFAAQPPSGYITVGWWRLGGSSRATCRSRWSLHLFVGVILSFNKLSSRRRRAVHNSRSESETQSDRRFHFVSSSDGVRVTSRDVDLEQHHRYGERHDSGDCGRSSPASRRTITPIPGSYAATKGRSEALCPRTEPVRCR